jgi:hypothetical protein
MEYSNIKCHLGCVNKKIDFYEMDKPKNKIGLF